nr:alpha-tocopherol transfer protein-like [Onthophagus taurus]
MYNDCVLSEDGLSEGYVVIFDMKGVALGHLARVSLPALKAFMVYIQEAHPARLKLIHVLNTPNFINHVMRIVLPLVKSELLSMVKFHKGRVPDGFPVELMPLEYGGEAPSIEVLDATTKSMTHKYIDWLKDTEKFRVDESKRPKKPSWWSIFGSTTTTQQSQNELTIEQQKENFFKNLQID